jgi:hypothetical protein
MPQCTPSTTILKKERKKEKRKKSGHLCPVPDFNGNSFSCSPFSIVLAEAET